MGASLTRSFRNYRVADLSQKLRIGGYRPLDVMVAGSTGAGKSTFINALFGNPVAKVGYGVDPETQQVADYRLNENFRIWDTPGLGDGVRIDWRHKQKITNLLLDTWNCDYETYGLVDLAVIVIEGAHRDLGSCYALLKDVIVPNIERDRILVVVNQADVAMKGAHWNVYDNEPDDTLRCFLRDQVLSVKRRIVEATGVDIKMPVCFSAETGYNVDAVYDFFIDNIPLCRRKICA